jgi:hypothetical protein
VRARDLSPRWNRVVLRVCGLHGLDVSHRNSGGDSLRVPVGEDDVVEVRETIFADDASLYSGSIEGMQKIVDACVLFCGFTGMRANLSKCRWMVAGGLNMGGGSISWSAVGTLVGEMGGCGGEASSFRVIGKFGGGVEVPGYLGVIQNGLGECHKMVSDLRDKMNDTAEIIKRKRMSLAGAIHCRMWCSCHERCIGLSYLMPLMNKSTQNTEWFT